MNALRSGRKPLAGRAGSLEHECGPFRNLSDLTQEAAEAVQRRLKERGDVFASRRSVDYLAIRRQLEERARELFILKGGEPARGRPQYMTLGACEWIKGWYRDGQLPAVAGGGPGDR